MAIQAQTFTLIGVIALVIAAVSPPVNISADQSEGASAKGRVTAKAGEGPRDLSGVWDFRSATPFERPAAVQDKSVLTEKDAAALQNEILAERAKFYSESPEYKVGYEPGVWFEQGKKLSGGRTSTIVDPPNGRLPPLTEYGKKRLAAMGERMRRPTIGPEDRSLSERCLAGFNAGPPMVPSYYNNIVQIFQTRDYVGILNEMNHDSRIVPVDHAAAPPRLPQWKGISRGRWEADTFVVETSGFRSEGTGHVDFGPAPDESLRVIERFTRIDADTLSYRFTVDNRAIWMSAWSGEVTMKKTTSPVYEYACHEGNYAMSSLLRAARAGDK